MTVADRPLVPSRLRLPAVLCVLVAAAVVGGLGARYAGDAGPRGFDMRVDDWFYARFAQHWSLAHHVADLANVPVIGMLIAVVAGGLLAARRVRGALLVAIAPCIAGAITQFLLKPLVGRTMAGGLAFPSGHTTGACGLAFAAVLVVAGSRLPIALRALASIIALAYGFAIACAVIAGHYHYATDTIGGACVALATVLTVALVIDIVWARWAVPERSAERADQPALTP